MFSFNKIFLSWNCSHNGSDVDGTQPSIKLIKELRSVLICILLVFFLACPSETWLSLEGKRTNGMKWPLEIIISMEVRERILQSILL